MTDNDLIEKIFREALDISQTDTISDHMCMNNTPSWDSLAQMTIIIQLKKEFDISFLYDEILSMNTLGKIKEITQKKICETER